jgi:ribosomal protein S18 acetylase RimI-like enzyme
MAVGIRPFMKDDAASVLKLANEYAAFDGTTSEADLAITGYFLEGFWVAEDDKGKIVGFVYGYIRDVSEQLLEKGKASKLGQVELMSVHPDHRGKGVGRRLLSKLLEKFREAGADMILVNCPANAIEAKDLYKEIGFDIKSYQMMLRL